MGLPSPLSLALILTRQGSGMYGQFFTAPGAWAGAGDTFSALNSLTRPVPTIV
jgi:hypothetical protein